MRQNLIFLEVIMKMLTDKLPLLSFYKLCMCSGVHEFERYSWVSRAPLLQLSHCDYELILFQPIVAMNMIEIFQKYCLSCIIKQNINFPFKLNVTFTASLLFVYVSFLQLSRPLYGHQLMKLCECNNFYNMHDYLCL